MFFKKKPQNKNQSILLAEWKENINLDIANKKKNSQVFLGQNL